MTAPYRLLQADERRRWWRGIVQRGVPAAVTLVLIVAMTVPLFASLPVMPQLGLLAVFVWATFQPGLMPPWLAFVLGGIADILFGQPLGIDALLFPATALTVRLVDARFGHQRYGIDWALAAAMIVAFELIQWQLLAFAGTPGPFAPLLVQTATTILTYPAVVQLCAHVQRRMQDRD